MEPKKQDLPDIVHALPEGHPAILQYELLLRRDSGLEDLDAITRHRNDFVSGGLTVRALIRVTPYM